MAYTLTRVYASDKDILFILIRYAIAMEGDREMPATQCTRTLPLLLRALSINSNAGPK